MIIPSRDQFVKQVAVLLLQDRGGNDAYVVGVSGRWGEGKSTFLDDLETDLKAGSAEVVRLNPWKYAKDDFSLMRQLLKTLVDKSGKKWPGQWILNRELQDMYYSREITGISLVFFGLTMLGCVLLYLPYYFISDVHDLVQKNKPLILLLLIPLTIAALNLFNARKKTSKSAETLDKFDELLKKVLAKYEDNKKIIIFVDDLDRLTADRAMLVLDNLRTFFDNVRLVFVVAADHTVLEAHLGRQLKPEGELAEQTEEGRRFLKKIFNLYWRLPIPTQSEVHSFIEELLDNENPRGQELRRHITNHHDVKRFKRLLANLYENNFRHIIRFVDRVIFTFQVLDVQLENTDIEQSKKAYLVEIKQNPLLLVRVLLLEDLTNPLYEIIMADSRILLDLEQQAIAPEGVGEIPGNLTQKQRALAKRILSTKPGFYGRNGLVVTNIGPFIHLANDPSFGDLRGLSAEDFFNLLTENDVERAKEAILESGGPKLEEAVAYLFDPAHMQIPATFDYISLLLKLSAQIIHTPTPLSLILFNHLRTAKTLDTELEALDSGRRAFFIYDLGVWAHAMQHMELQYTELFDGLYASIGSRLGHGDLPHFMDKAASLDTAQFSPQMSKILGHSFVEIYKQDTHRAVAYFARNIIDRVDAEAFAKTLTPAMITSIATASFVPATDVRDHGAHILASLTDDKEADATVGQLLTEKLSYNAYAWDVAKAMDVYLKRSYISEEAMQDNALDALRSVGSADELYEKLIFLSDKINLPAYVNIAWRMAADHPEYFAQIFPRFTEAALPSTFVPSQNTITKLLATVLSRLRTNDRLLSKVLHHIRPTNRLLINYTGPDQRTKAILRKLYATSQNSDHQNYISAIADEYDVKLN